jgi:DNA-binding MarR family transcriptional regulator
VTKVERLSPAEDNVWRALMRIVLLLPRRLDSDLMRTVGISSNEYVTVMSLSEAPSHELRMTDLARAVAVSASRMTRVVEELESRGLVTKRSSTRDGRGNLACLTSAGQAKLEEASAVYVSSVRTLAFDHLDQATSNDAAQALAEIAVQLECRR